MLGAIILIVIGVVGYYIDYKIIKSFIKEFKQK